MTEHKFPKEFASCPACGSTRRFLQEVAQGLKMEKDAADETPVLLTAEHIFPSVPPVKAVAHFDCCWDCGFLYPLVLMRFVAKPLLYVPGRQPGYSFN